jgi:hypothetical protein
MLQWGIIGASVIADVRMAPAIREAAGCEEEERVYHHI